MAEVPHNYLITFTDGTSKVYTFTLAELEAFVTLNAAFIVSVKDLGPVEPPPPPPSPPPPVTYYTLTVNISPSGAGGVVLDPWGDYISPGKIRYPAGTVVRLTATPSIVGAYFDHWEGALSGAANPTTITMNSDKTVYAVFIVPVAVIRLTTSVIGNGRIDPSEGIYNKGDKIILSATPDSGHNFVSWSGDIDGAEPVPGMPNQLRVTMDRDRHITAQFELAPVPPPPGEPQFRNLEVVISK